MEEQQDYTIKLLEQTDEGCKYGIEVVLPMSLGWIDDVYYYAEHGNKRESFKISHAFNDEKNVHFVSEIFLPTKAIYRTYFSFTANKVILYLNKKRQVVDFLDNNTLDKISVNFDTPEWAKGAMMYHIFVDRFNRGSKKKMEPI